MDRENYWQYAQMSFNHFWSALAVEECVRQGIRHILIAPGSRSTPLTMAAVRHPDVEAHIHFDERGLGFWALGMVMALNGPVAVITTSGTAVANLYPALIETAKKKLPLLIFTADRPPELRDTGANQTIDQNRIFSPGYIRWFVDVPTPTPDITPEYVLTTVDQAVAMATQPTLRGPVHLNWMFRDPLTPQGEDAVVVNPQINDWLDHQLPYTQRTVPTVSELIITEPQLNQIRGVNGLLMVGKVGDEHTRSQILALAEHLNWPLFADITSGIRHQSSSAHVIHHWPELLPSPEHPLDGQLPVVIHLGGRITDPAWLQFIEHDPPREYWTVLAHPLRNDPQHRVTHRWQCSIDLFCQTLMSQPLESASEHWPAWWAKRDRALAQRLDHQLSAGTADGHWHEPWVIRQLTAALPDDWDLFVGNSMPIRLLDQFCARRQQAMTIVANRGASGIDGNIATAIGWQMIRQKPMAMIIGDLTALYDLNSLPILKNRDMPFVIFVLNNQGGGIFDRLPVARYEDVHESAFVAAHHLDCNGIAQWAGWRYASVHDANTFSRVVQTIWSAPQPMICELKMPREKTNAFFNQLNQSQSC
jgi:2-succinyl-5-enolpyruvyl-6-hydroxy-3-cyclohexene-1-carboxylate synthase